MRDEFPASVKRLLADRAGHCCSAPNCKAQTIGADSTNEGVSRIGVAAHICAASPGGKRFDATMTTAERISIDNGIWLCGNHAKIIDDDEIRYTTPLLHSWKNLAEAESHNALGKPRHLDHRRLARYTKSITSIDASKKVVADFLEDVGVSSWGKWSASITRNAIYEIVLNHLVHSNSESIVELSSTEWSIEIAAKGPKFGVIDLLDCEHGRGGQAALEALRDNYLETLSLEHMYDRSTNYWQLTNKLIEGYAGPCSLDMRDMRKGDGQPYLERLSKCDEIHIYSVPNFSFSDSYLFSWVAELAEGRDCIIHGVDDEPTIRAYISKIIPGARFD